MRDINKSIFLTIYDKCLILASIALLLAFGVSIPVYANESDSSLVSYTETSVLDTEIAASDTHSDITYTVTEIENSEELSHLEPIEITRRASSQDTEVLGNYIRANDLETVNATITDNAGNSSNIELTVAWDFSQTDTSVCGEYTATGTIRLPDASCGNYQWEEGVINTLSLTIIVTEPEEPVEIVRIDSYESDFNMAFSLELNSDIDAFLSTVSLQQACDCYDAVGNVYLCPIVYNTEAVRTDSVGIYHITATFEAPFNCRFSESLNLNRPTYSIPVSVQAAGQPRLDLSYIGTFTGFICFPWITSGIDLNTMEVWISENNGEWRLMEINDEVYLHSTQMEIDPWLLTADNFYRIQVDYEGGQTGIASFTYGWDMLSDKEYIEGDRDGGDTDGNPPNDSEDNENTEIIPPNDSPANENTDVAPPNDSPANENTDVAPPNDSPANENTEIIPPTVPADNENISGTDDTVTPPKKEDTVTIENNISGNNTSNENEGSESQKTTEEPAVKREEPYLLGSEIALMLENLGTARFSAEAIMLDIPTDVITSLGISDTDRLLVTILPLENNGFSIDISKNDIAVTTVSSMQISMPYQPPENTTPVLINEAGKEVASGDYKPDTGLVTFTIQETGTFYIKDVKAKGQDVVSVKNLTATEISVSEKDNDNSVFKLVAIVATVIITCSVAVTIFFYTKKRRR